MATSTATIEVEEKAAASAAEIVGGLAVLDANYAVVSIKTAEEYQYHGDAMLELNRRIKLIDAKEEDLLEPLRDAKRGIDKTMRNIKVLFDGPRTILDRIRQRISLGMTGYQRAQEEAARVERDRLALEASKEQERIRKEAERQAQRAEKAGDDQAAALLRASAEQITVPAPMVDAAVPKVAGLATRENWRGEVYDLVALAMGVACGEVPMTAIQPVQAVINQSARAAKGQLNWPGVRAVCETTVVGTGR